ncbi:MAG: hypothetical protein ACI9CB_002154 [Rhodothermales bacterium]|jgi:hypothetical protein
MRYIYALVLAAGFHSPVLLAQEAAGVIAVPETCQEAITGFQDVSGMGRKDKAASNMTKRHQEMAKQGWRFIGLEVYTENGDLEGFFLSYVRDVACPLIPAN